jgi:integrase/recombinase XerC
LLLLTEAIDRFLLSLEANGRAIATISTYRWRLTDFRESVEAGGIVSVESLSPETLDAWAVSLHRQPTRWADHPTRPARSGGLSAVSIAGRVQAIKTFLTWCIRRGYLESSPADHLEKPAVDLDASGRVMSTDDLAAIVAKADELARSGKRLAVRDYAIVAFCAETGCRPGEVVSLSTGGLNLASCEAIIGGKTGSRRVMFTERAALALSAWLSARPEVCDHGRVFVSRTGTPLTVSGLYQVFKRLASQSGVCGRYNPHAVRHLVGQTFTDGANLELAREKLGHSSVVTTARFYAHQDGKRLREATRRLSLLNDDDGEG